MIIQIGSMIRTYNLFLTRAPKAYDGFGTLTVQGSSAGDQRLVAIDEQHQSWQTQRYASGMFTAKPAGQFFEQAAQDILVKRLLDPDDN